MTGSFPKTTNILQTAALISAAAIGLATCSSDRPDASGAGGEVAATGDVILALDVAPGISLDSVAYAITGPAGFTRASSINVGSSSTISALVSVIPPGAGYSITLTSLARDGKTSCSGATPFTVVARATTMVAVHLTCRESPSTGTILVNGNVNVCPSIDGISAVPSEVIVGSSLALNAVAHDSDAAPAPLSYAWTATSGTLSSASVANPTFQCTAPGNATLRVVVSDGDSTAGCADTRSVTVVCTAGPM